MTRRLLPHDLLPWQMVYHCLRSWSMRASGNASTTAWSWPTARVAAGRPPARRRSAPVVDCASQIKRWRQGLRHRRKPGERVSPCRRHPGSRLWGKLSPKALAAMPGVLLQEPPTRSTSPPDRQPLHQGQKLRRRAASTGGRANLSLTLQRPAPRPQLQVDHRRCRSSHHHRSVSHTPAPNPNAQISSQTRSKTYSNSTREIYPHSLCRVGILL